MSGRREILVLRALGLGDFMTSLPALRALRAEYGDTRITLAGPDWLDPLVRWTGAADEALAFTGIDDPPKDRRPAVAVNLHGRGPQSHRWILATRPGRLVSFRHRDVPASMWGPMWSPGEHEVARWCRMLRWFGMEADATRLEIPPPPPPAHDLVGSVVVHPGAKDAARRWPPDRWAQVAAALTARGRHVVVTGSRDERPLAARVAAGARLGPDSVVAGELDVLELAGLVANAGAVLCGDTGVAHVATALGRPSVLLFGPTPPWRWGPPPSPRHRVLWAGRAGDPHAREPCRGLLAISVDDVVRAFDDLPRPAFSLGAGMAREASSRVDAGR
jgi:ADP-heptose:LPS heptosyltransferase